MIANRDLQRRMYIRYQAIHTDRWTILKFELLGQHLVEYKLVMKVQVSACWWSTEGVTRKLQLFIGTLQTRYLVSAVFGQNYLSSSDVCSRERSRES